MWQRSSGIFIALVGIWIGAFLYNELPTGYHFASYITGMILCFFGLLIATTETFNG